APGCEERPKRTSSYRDLYATAIATICSCGGEPRRAEWTMTRLIGVIVAGVLCLPIASIAQEPVVTLRADVVIDGTGNTLRNTNIVVRGTKIQSIGQTTAQGPVYDLRGLAVMPGWIDTHAHISGHFDRKTGRLPEEGSETPQQTML